MRGKHLGSRHLYTDQRDVELLLAYRKSLETLFKRKKKIRVEEAIDMARNTPASRYFVSEDKAYRIIQGIEQGHNPLLGMSEMRRSMFECLYNQYLSLKRSFPKDTIKELVTMACCSPAPHFFMTRASAYQTLTLIRRHLKNNGIATSNQAL